MPLAESQDDFPNGAFRYAKTASKVKPSVSRTPAATLRYWVNVPLRSKRRS